jgi:hypothetical protein
MNYNLNAMDPNYNVYAGPVNEPQMRTPTVVDLTDELGKRIRELRDAATRVTEGMIGERIDPPEGGDGSLPDRVKWMMETLFRITEALKRAGGFLG